MDSGRVLIPLLLWCFYQLVKLKNEEKEEEEETMKEGF